MPKQNLRPTIGLTANLEDGRVTLRDAYLEAVWNAGGTPLILPPVLGSAEAMIQSVDAIIFTGGDDPDMRQFGEPLHPEAILIDPRRQAFEMELLDELQKHQRLPVLGICLGMQLMGLHGGGQLAQYLADSLPTAKDHIEGRVHLVEGVVGSGHVYSHHRQALVDPGRFEVAALAPDGVIEAIRDPALHHRIGVQWHPERTSEPQLGAGLFQELVSAAQKRT